jgi:hypothetical protein
VGVQTRRLGRTAVDKPQVISRQIGLTRGKAILIATLSVVLLVVLYIQYGPSGEEYVAPAAAYRRTAASTASSGAAAPVPGVTTTSAGTKTAAQASTAINPAQWKAPDLSSVIAFDPFAVPESFPQSLQVAAAGDDGSGSGDAAVAAEQLTNAIEQLRLELQELQERGVHVILKQRRTVRVGDEINGFTVTAIEPDHVRVEWKVEK